LFALTLRYGQVHAAELDAARRVAVALGCVKHLELAVDLGGFGGSALTGEGPVPKDRPLDADEIPSTYVPARNTIFLSLALAWAEVLHARHIVIGVNALDYSGYPDCRPEISRPSITSRDWPLAPAWKAARRDPAPLST
jgi:7-cyano-7-deazaguanine synthase